MSYTTKTNYLVNLKLVTTHDIMLDLITINLSNILIDMNVRINFYEIQPELFKQRYVFLTCKLMERIRFDCFIKQNSLNSSS